MTPIIQLEILTTNLSDLWVKTVEGKYYWGIMTYDAIQWAEIPSTLFSELFNTKTWTIS